MTALRRWWSALWLAAFAPAVLRCAPEDVVLFELPALAGMSGSANGGAVNGGSAGSAGASGGTNAGSGGTSAGSGGTATGGVATGGTAAGTVCADDSDCPDSWECQKTACADASGVCEPGIVICDPLPDPVCGCDQVTYWNDCVRRQGGAPAATPGECRGDARKCQTSADCGLERASCAHLYSPEDRCGPSDGGTCWVVPSNCEAGEPRRWLECPSGLPGTGVPPPPPPPPGTPLPCVDTCEAISTERSYFPVPPRAPCE